MTVEAQMKIRLPEELKREIDLAAAKSRRSLNAEIVARLEMTFATGATFYESGFNLPVSPGSDDQPLEKRVSALEAKLARLGKLLGD